MAYYPELDTPCAHGRFIVSDVFVGVQPVRGRSRRHHWAVRRNAVSGADVVWTVTGYSLAICLRGGQQLEVAGIGPEQAVAAVELLGHAPAARMRVPRRRARLPLHLRCRQGRLVIMPDRVLMRSGMAWHRRPRWALPRSVISGVSAQLLPGERKLHDLTLHTVDGEAIHLDHVSAADTLSAITLLGYAGAPERARAAVRQARLARQLAQRAWAEDDVVDDEEDAEEDAQAFDARPTGDDQGEWHERGDLEELFRPAAVT